jgi:hypothetical protein
VEENQEQRRSKGRKIAAAVLGVIAAGAGAFAATNWIVGLSGGSSGESQSSAVLPVSINAVASPVAGNLLFPTGTGDVVATVTNPNKFAVTVTAVNLPTNSNFAGGFSNSGLTTAQTGCDASATGSDVTWTGSTATSGSVHTLANNLVVAGNGSLTVTFTNEATMGDGASASCESTYFKMPSLTGVAATASDNDTVETGQVSDTWS